MESTSKDTSVAITSVPSIVITPPSPVIQRVDTPTICEESLSVISEDLDHESKLHSGDSARSSKSSTMQELEIGCASHSSEQNQTLLNVSTSNDSSFISGQLTNLSESPDRLVESDTSHFCCYSSTPKNKTEHCFDENVLSAIVTTSPIPFQDSGEGCCGLLETTANSNFDSSSQQGLSGLSTIPQCGDLLQMDSNYLNQSYNRTVQLPGKNDDHPLKERYPFGSTEGLDQSTVDVEEASQHNCFSPSGCYHTKNTSSWLDLTQPYDLSPSPQLPIHGPNDYNMGGMGGVPPDSGEFFVYPSIYVSSAGLISVLLKSDISVEMTVDRTIRVVSHHHMMAVATDSRGTAACLYHPAVKVFQLATTTNIATDNFRARMGAENTIVFSNGATHFKLDEWELQPTDPLKFTNILRDQSVNLLFSSEGYGETLVASCMQVAAQAEYANLPRNGVTVRINGVKVTQTGNGDVTVVTGAKFIRLSPHLGTTRLSNRFVDIEVEKDWSVRLNRGTHRFYHARKCSMVSNGKMEAGYDESNRLKVVQVQNRHPLFVEPANARRPVNKSPVSRPLMSTTYTRKRKPGLSQGKGGEFSGGPGFQQV